MKIANPNDSTLVLIPNLIIEVRRTCDKSLTDRIETHNIVTDRGLVVLRDNLAGTGARVNFLGVGDNASSESSSDTNLANEVYRQLITRRVEISDGLKFETFIGSADANGNNLVESGLIVTGLQHGDAGDPIDALFSRATHASITKTASIEVTYSWSIVFSQV